MTAQANTNANTSNNTNTFSGDDFSFQLKLGKTGRKVAAGVGATLVVGAAVYAAHKFGYLPNPFGSATSEEAAPAA